ncbi:MAG: DUF5400 family protein [Candidatus Thorarchaeota archaeon]|nr:DUF5400 family protein [Candidatus Thorarchaeota archaeon]MCK5238246.1 DUF5400 family protein [Candidatus Thorarchaeota archaeon]
MAFYQLLLFVLFALNMSAMFSGFLLARRMGMYLMMQVMMLMFAMMIGLVALILPFIGFADFVYWLVLVDLVLVLIAFLLEFGTVLPILMKTMQGAPIHSAHITNLIMSLFYLIGLVLFWSELILI